MAGRILIIDDNIDYSEAIKTILEGEKYEVRIANSSDDAIRKLEGAIPDLIILDIVMQKGAEGILLSRRIKRDPRWSRIPILMLTSITRQTGFHFSEGDPRDPKYLPVDAYAEKPIAIPALLEKVNHLISQGQKA